jgi:hypothetical protein
VNTTRIAIIGLGAAAAIGMVAVLRQHLAYSALSPAAPDRDSAQVLHPLPASAGPTAAVSRLGNPFRAPRLTADQRQLLTADPRAALERLASDPVGAGPAMLLDFLAAWAASDSEAAMAWLDGPREEGELPYGRVDLLGAVAAGILLKDGPVAMGEFAACHENDPRMPPKYHDRLSILGRGMSVLGREDSFEAALALLAAVGDGKMTEWANPDASPGLAFQMVAGVKGGPDEQARAIDFLEAKGISVTTDYWAFQSLVGEDHRYWADWAWKRESAMLPEIIQSWNRDQSGEAREWLNDRLPPDDPRRKDIEELLDP